MLAASGCRCNHGCQAHAPQQQAAVRRIRQQHAVACINPACMGSCQPAACSPLRAQCPGTLANVLFQGAVLNQVVCLSCGHESNTWDPIQVRGCGLWAMHAVRWQLLE